MAEDFYLKTTFDKLSISLFRSSLSYCWDTCQKRYSRWAAKWHSTATVISPGLSNSV